VIRFHCKKNEELLKCCKEMDLQLPLEEKS